jgi:hypothetical protein
MTDNAFFSDRANSSQSMALTTTIPWAALHGIAGMSGDARETQVEEAGLLTHHLTWPRSPVQVIFMAMNGEWGSTIE